MNRDFARSITVLVFAIGQIATTFWPITGLGENVQLRSDSLPTPLVPIGWTFAIWGLIYLGATIYAIWQFLPNNRTLELNRRVGWLIAYMYAVNSLWQVWVSLFGFGWPDFLGLASEAVVGTAALFMVTRLQTQGRVPSLHVVFAVLPLALLTGWTTAASFVGSTVSASAMSLAWASDPEVGIVILAVGLLVGFVLTLAHRHATYALAIAWAAWGLYANALAKGLEGIAVLALVGVGALIGAAIAVDGWKIYRAWMAKR